MSFIKEKISDADKIRIDWKKFHIQHPTTWVIDRDKDVFLIMKTYGQPDGLTPKSLLSWRGEIIPVHMKGVWESKAGDCEVTGVRIPPGLESQRVEILVALKEALIAHGLCLRVIGI